MKKFIDIMKNDNVLLIILGTGILCWITTAFLIYFGYGDTNISHAFSIIGGSCVGSSIGMIIAEKI